MTFLSYYLLDLGADRDERSLLLLFFFFFFVFCKILSGTLCRTLNREHDTQQTPVSASSASPQTLMGFLPQITFCLEIRVNIPVSNLSAKVREEHDHLLPCLPQRNGPEQNVAVGVLLKRDLHLRPGVAELPV